MSKTGRDRIFTFIFLVIVAAFFIVNMGVETLYSTFSLYVNSIGASASSAGVLSAVFGVTCIVARVLSGLLVDAKSRWFTLLIGGGLFGLSIVLCGFVESYAGLFVIRVLQAIGYSAATTATAASVAACIAPERLGEAIGYYGIGQSVATAVAPPVALALAAEIGYRGVYMCFGILTAFVALLALSVRGGEIRGPRKSMSVDSSADADDSGFGPKLFPATAVNFVISFSVASIISFITLYAAHRGFEQAGLFYTVAAVMMFLAKLIAGRISDRFGHLVVLVPGIILGCVFCSALALTSNIAVFLLCGAAYGFCNGMFIPVLNALAVRDTPEWRVGAASAIFYCGLDAGVGVGSVAWGLVIDNLGFAAMYFGSAGCFLVALVLVLFLLRETRFRRGAAKTTV